MYGATLATLPGVGYLSGNAVAAFLIKPIGHQRMQCLVIISISGALLAGKFLIRQQANIATDF